MNQLPVICQRNLASQVLGDAIEGAVASGTDYRLADAWLSAAAGKGQPPRWCKVQRGGSYVRVVIRGELGLGEPEAVAVCDEIRSAEHVDVLLDSIGGCALTADKLRAALTGKNSRAVIRHAGSAAGIVALGCQRRIAFTDARLMFHAARAVVFGPGRKLRDEAENLDAISARWLADVARITGQPRRTVRAWFRAEKVFSAPESLKAGLVHEIIGPAPQLPDATPPGEPEDALGPLLKALDGVPKLRLTASERARLHQELQMWLIMNVRAV